MRRIVISAAVAVCSLTSGTFLAAEEWGDLSATFVYAGDPPEAGPLEVTTDKAFCGQFSVLDESLVVNPENKGIANVLAWLYLGRNDESPAPHPSYAETAESKVLLDNNECRFDPHVALLRTSQTLVIGNSDKVGHNCKADLFLNPPFNITIPAGGKAEREFAVPERLPAQVSCSIHPWMSGWLLIKDHPYMAVSDENGKLEIKNLPVGQWTIQFWHEKGGYVAQVSRSGQAVDWPRGRLDVEVKAGKNDLGTIQLAPSLFAEP